MIAGIGTDIVAVARLGGLYERHGQRALAKLLSAVRECTEFVACAPAGALSRQAFRRQGSFRQGARASV
jgi:holo-[acyl-carrier protein] synthase